MTYSQHGEDLIIDELNIINEHSTILDIGANDGITFSNSRMFIQKYNCNAFLVEPTSNCVSLLNDLYKNTKNVHVLPYAISTQTGELEINIGNLMDLPTCINQVSTLLDSEKQYWESSRGVEYSNEIVQSIQPKQLIDMIKSYDINNVDLLSIDTEGLDYFILNELYSLDIIPKIIIFEWNRKNDVLSKCMELLSSKYELIYKNDVNLIFKLS
jgi:FkbM family methyltransferase